MKLQELDSNDLELLAEALHRLREVKVAAHATVAASPGYAHFTLADFGVPKIDALQAKIDATLNQANTEVAA